MASGRQNVKRSGSRRQDLALSPKQGWWPSAFITKFLAHRTECVCHKYTVGKSETGLTQTKLRNTSSKCQPVVMRPEEIERIKEIGKEPLAIQKNELRVIEYKVIIYIEFADWRPLGIINVYVHLTDFKYQMHILLHYLYIIYNIKYLFTLCNIEYYISILLLIKFLNIIFWKDCLPCVSNVIQGFGKVDSVSLK